jgi:DNA-binding CsgD family transcriptional regulator
MDGAHLALSFLNESFGHHDPGQLRARALERVCRLVGADHAMFASYTDEFFAAPPEYIKRYLSSPVYRRSLSRAFRAARAQGGIYVDVEVFSPRERRQMRFFADVLGPDRIRSQIVATVHFAGRPSGVIHLNRDGRVFRAEDADRLQPLLTAIGVAHAALEPCVPEIARAAPRSTRLTPREREIAERIAQGESNAAIAGYLGRSIHTVRRHVESILGKCGVATRAAVAGLVGRNLLLAPRVPSLPPGIGTDLLHEAWGDMARSIPGT